MLPLRTHRQQETRAELRVLQINLARCRAAQDLMLHTAKEAGADVVVACEVYRPPGGNGRWAVDPSGQVAVVATGVHPIQRVWSSVSGMVAAQIGGICFVSCYASPSWTLGRFREFLDSVETEARAHSQIVLAGDFNAWHTAWGSARNKPKGEELKDAAEYLDLAILNRGSIPTFTGNGAAPASVVDVSFASPDLARPDTWRVLTSVFSASDHRYLWFTVNRPQQFPVGRGEVSGHTSSSNGRLAGRRWRQRQFDAELFGDALRHQDFVATADSPEGLVAGLSRACDETMQRNNSPAFQVSPCAYWWTPALDRLRDTCLAAQQRYLATADPGARRVAAEHHLSLKARLSHAIKVNKDACFNELIREAEDNAFGAGYKVVMARLRGSRAPPERDRAELDRIVTDLFPEHDPMVWQTPQAAPGDVPSTRAVTDEELLQIARCLAPRKAPGLDGICNGALKVAICQYPEAFRRVYQSCFDHGVFPLPWKEQRLVLLAKPGKPPGESSSFRPLGMLNGAGKVLERLILDRLNEHLEAPENPRLHPAQYGFRRGRSTTQAILRVVGACRRVLSLDTREPVTRRHVHHCLMVVAIDVRNAFNEASWRHIAAACVDKEVPGELQRLLASWMADRRLIYDTSEGPASRSLSAGVPQGSILGPTLWNIMYDGVLSVDLPDGVELVAYADDLVLLAEDVCPQAASERAAAGIRAVNEWMVAHSLSIAPLKTEAVLVSKRAGDNPVTVLVNDQEVRSCSDIRYLGVQIHEHLSWLPHLRKVAEKAEAIGKAVSRLLQNHSGPKGVKRRLLASVVESVLRYAAPVWHTACDLRAGRRILERAQRQVVLRAATAFRTTSFRVAAIIAGIVPVWRLAKEDARCYERQQLSSQTASAKEIRIQERAITVRSWQEQYDLDAVDPELSAKVAWTHRLLPDLGSWLDRKHGEVNFHLCQLLSGHGFFRAHLKSMRFTESPFCCSCQDIEETPEHAIFECPRFAAVRADFALLGGDVPVAPDTLQWHLLRGPEEWSRVTEVVRRIMVTLQRDWDQERARLARERQEAAERAEPELAAAREAARIARRRAANDRRNASRREARARERAERERLNSTQPPSPATAARRAAVAQRVREHRARHPRTRSRRQASYPSRSRSRSRRSSRSRTTSASTDGGQVIAAESRVDPEGRTRGSRRRRSAIRASSVSPLEYTRRSRSPVREPDVEDRSRRNRRRQQAREELVGERTSRSPLTAAEEAAIVEESTSGR